MSHAIDRGDPRSASLFRFDYTENFEVSNFESTMAAAVQINAIKSLRKLDKGNAKDSVVPFPRHHDL
jgi:hypothetical protein